MSQPDPKLTLIVASPSSCFRSSKSLTSTQEVVDIIIEAVVDRAVEAACDEVRRSTGIDPLQRGYEPKRSYEPVDFGTSEETRRELRRLNEEHDRTIAKLEEQLSRKLNNAETEFKREAECEDKLDQVAEKREKLL